ncbi:MAG: hypothetical protein MPI95_00905 [Nitrosopumilus sp.]|nr:hypothetical protein [Nitrosopumilus sp.]CAI9832092.1 putative 30S ribosomal protein S17e [Nitrosopumilaceae archaeon]MDA7941409.1 hypothetical protein [Nitrosopumilus sp.]MDA7942817.1 hypothetical protein [Nitrosopumilus sp.]MDA7945103.1 hypothetical protein [Nitrosopumilus sp.]
MNRIRRLSDEVLERHPGIFGCGFARNKEILDGVAVVRSKELKNEITGYITRRLVRDVRALAGEVLEAHPGIFGCDLEENVKALNSVADVRPEKLGDEIAGYITGKLERERDKRTVEPKAAEEPEGEPQEQTAKKPPQEADRLILQSSYWPDPLTGP